MNGWHNALSWLILRPPVDVYAGPALFALLLLCFWKELRHPLRRLVQPQFRRLLINGAVAAPGMILARLLLLPATVWAAWAAAQYHFGLVRLLPLPPLVPLPQLVRGLLAFLLLDYSIYAWHWLNHRIPFLWRFHNVHHTDLDLTVSTAFRFHFGEMALSALYRSAVVGLVGASPLVALVYEFTLDGATAFEHSNWRLPYRLEQVLSWVMVTPGMHGIHHSIVERETNSNWSTIFSWWDRLHGTLKLGIPQEEITIGVPAYRDPAELTIKSLLLMPFRRQRAYWQLPSVEHPDQVPRSEHRVRTPQPGLKEE